MSSSSTPGCSTQEARTCTDDVCITCSDEGRVAEVSAVYWPTAGPRCWRAGGAETGRRQPGRRRRPGDLVLVHAGVAVTSAHGGAWSR